MSPIPPEALPIRRPHVLPICTVATVLALLLPGIASSIGPRQALFPQAPAGQEAILVRVAYAPPIRRLDDWARQLRTAIAQANRILEPHLQRPLEVLETVEWPDGSSPGSPDELLASLLESATFGDADIVIGLAAGAQYQGYMDGGENLGVALYRQGYAVLRLEGAVQGAGRLLAHEIAHLYGGVHIPGEGRLMNPRPDGDAVDELNAELLSLHRSRKFDDLSPPLAAADLPRARQIYQQAATLGGDFDNLDSRLLLARLNSDSGRAEEAIGDLRNLLLETPGSLEARILMGIALRRAHQYEAAIAAYDEILEARPNDFRVLFNKAIALRESGDSAAAIAHYERILAVRAEYVPALVNLSEVYAESGEAESALAVAERAASVAPRHPQVAANLAFAQFAAGMYAAAEQQSHELLARYPDSAVAHNTIGKLHQVASRRAESIASFERATQLDPSYADAWLNLAQAYVGEGELQRAADAVSVAAQLRPRSVAAQMISGRVQLQLGNWQRAIESLEAAVAIDAANPSFRAELGYAYLRAGDLENADEATRAALAGDPSMHWALVNLGVIAALRGDLEGAVSIYETALGIEPEYADAHLNLGHAYLEQRRFEAAEDTYGRALQLGGPPGTIFNNLANIRYQLEDYAGAFDRAQQAVDAGFQLDPQFAAELERLTGRRLRRRHSRP